MPNTPRVLNQPIPLNELSATGAAWRARGGSLMERTSSQVLAWADLQPDSPALRDESVAMSYGELASAIHETVATLQALGIEPGDRLMVIGENCVALGVLLLAASQLGACAVLENARRVPAEIQAIISHCLPKRIFIIFANSPDAVRHASVLFAQEHRTKALGGFGVAPLREASCTAEVEPTPEHVAVIIYTTGTTGQPKGVMLTHRNLCYIAAMMRELRHLTPRDHVYGVLPITHVMGHASVFLGALHAGSSLNLAARFLVKECVATLLRHRITALQGAPAMFAKIAEYCKARGNIRFHDVRFVGSGGAPIDPTIKSDVESLFGCTLQNGYGLTEAASICWTRFEDANRDDSVGRPLPGVEVAVRSTNGQIVAAGEIGELWVRGPNLMHGYFRNPELTASVIDRAGWFNTQDLARIEQDGRVFVVGRTKDMINRSGFKIYPLEVESVLNAHPAVLHAAVIGRQVPGNEEVVAYVELVSNSTINAEQLSQYAAQLLSPYKRPTQFVIVPALPLAANGKVLKSQLPHCPAQDGNLENQKKGEK
jgi:acyl-CoA synthetase (AMP-forming)/AMP-acid ligase II